MSTPGSGRGRAPVDGSVPPSGAQPLGDVAARLRAAGCVFAEEEAALLAGHAASPAALESLVARRVAGEPVEHLVGWVAFAGLRVRVGPGVFVPRRRTELLAEQAASLAAEVTAGPCRVAGPPVVVDLCCGSGAVAAVVLDRVPGALVHAADVDPVAVRCARRNLEPTGAVVHEGDLLDALPGSLRGGVDVLVANVPYVPSAAVASMPVEARAHEPRRALDGGPDGLDLLRRVAAQARTWLRPGGHLLVETSTAQADAASTVVAAHGLHPHLVHDEDRDATALIAR